MAVGVDHRRHPAVIRAAGLRVNVLHLRRAAGVDRAAGGLIFAGQLAVAIINVLGLVDDGRFAGVAVAGLLVRQAHAVVAVAQGTDGAVNAGAQGRDDVPFEAAQNVVLVGVRVAVLIGKRDSVASKGTAILVSPGCSQNCGRLFCPQRKSLKSLRCGAKFRPSVSQVELPEGARTG